MTYLIYFAVEFGLAWGIARSSLTYRIRERLHPVPFFGELFNCVVCTGFWLSVAASLFGLPVRVGLLQGRIAEAICLGLATATVNLIIGHHTGALTQEPFDA